MINIVMSEHVHSSRSGYLILKSKIISVLPGFNCQITITQNLGRFEKKINLLLKEMRDILFSDNKIKHRI